jgi:SnoaL-like domain
MPQTVPPEQAPEEFKQGYECWQSGELDVSAVFTDTRPYRGKESMRRYWAEVWEAWEGSRMEPLQVFDVGGGRFAVDLRLWGKGKRSGAEIDQRFGCLYTLRPSDNKIVRCRLFPTLEAAMDSAQGG